MNQLHKYIHRGQFGEVFKVFVIVARCYCIFFGIIAVSGTAWFGIQFRSVAAALAFISALIPATKDEDNNDRSKYLLIGSLSALLFEAFDIVHYYWKINIPGNNFAWNFIVPLIGALIILALHGGTTLPSKQINTSEFNEKQV